MRKTPEKKKKHKTRGRTSPKPVVTSKPPKAVFKAEVKVYPTSTALFEETAHLFLETALEAVRQRGRFVTALSGGSTPKALFQQLSAEPYLSLMPWAKTFCFWVDERHVPLTSDDSNYHMARKFLFSKVPISPDNLFPITDSSRPVAEAAKQYERALGQFFATKEFPRFDLTLLGMGEDGHTASLFPGMPQLNERDKWVVGYFVDEARKERVSLTFPVLNASRLAVVLLEGEKKAGRLKDVLEGPPNPPRYPVQYLRPTEGRLLFLMDSSAASLLRSKPR